MYKGQKELDLQLGDSGHTTTEIEVVVGRTPRPIILVLSAYEPVVWKVGSTSAARIAVVLVSGHHTQALIGIPRSMPHRVLSTEGPGGVSYSPELTVDDDPVLRSEIPAGEKGIDTLQRLGKIRLATARDVAAWSGDKAQQSKLASYVGMGRVYVVLEKVTLPSGLYGADGRDFIIPLGVPRPKGPKAHCSFYYLKDHTFE